jgi:hypothetical protein
MAGIAMMIVLAPHLNVARRENFLVHSRMLSS